MPSYILNPHKHVKIWFSKNENVFLNSDNQLRLVKFRENNKKDEISFIYSKTILSNKAQRDLSDFCNTHKISFYSIEEDISPHLVSTEKELMQYAVMEIQAAKANAGGSFAAASDIIRALSSVYTKGIYSDLDEYSISTKDLPSQIPVSAPMLLDIGSFAIPTDYTSEETKAEVIEATIINNDIIAVPEIDQSKSIEEQHESEARQRQFIDSYQQMILSGYKDFRGSFNKLLKFFDAQTFKYTNLSCYPDEHPRNLIYSILRDIQGDDPITVRNNINKIISDPLERMKHILLYHDYFFKKFPYSEPDINYEFSVKYEKENESLRTAVKNNRLDLIKDFYISFAKDKINQIIYCGSDEQKAHLLNMVELREKKYSGQIAEILIDVNEKIKKIILKQIKYLDDESDSENEIIDDSIDAFEEKLEIDDIRKTIKKVLANRDEEIAVEMSIEAFEEKLKIENIGKKIKKILSNRDEEIAVEFSKEDINFGDNFMAFLYKESVVSLTGPTVGIYLLGAGILPKEQVDTNVAPYSFQFYDTLKDRFKSGNVKGLHLEAYDLKPTDSSWLPAGTKKMEEREEQLNKDAKRLQGVMQRLFAKRREIKSQNNDLSSPNPTNKR